MSTRFRIVKHVVNCAHTREYPAATRNGDSNRPRIAVKQYIPIDNPEPRPGDLTIIAAHANGFPKELYEPLWDEVQDRAGGGGLKIRSIWIADMWNQGHSGILNESMLGNDPSWFDHARDLMKLINDKQDEMPRPLVGIGHSMGATQITQLALAHPRLFWSVVLIDPVIQRSNGSISPAVLSTRRREIWPSRKLAMDKMKMSPFYQAWDSRVFERWVKYGLRDCPTELFPTDGKGDTRVTLTTSKPQELFTFLRPTYRNDPTEGFLDLDPRSKAEHPGYPFYRPEPAKVFGRLAELRPSTLYVFGKKSELSSSRERDIKVRITGSGVGGSGGYGAGRVHQEVLDSGHLVAMERVQECAEAISKFLHQEIGRYEKEAYAFSSYLQNQSKSSMITLDPTWTARVNPESQGQTTTEPQPSVKTKM